MELEIRRAGHAELAAVCTLALCLWPGHERVELEEEFAELLQKSDAALFLASDGALPIGFAQCQLRHDYVEGTETSPVGYLEGIYVAEEARNRGIARALLQSCEQWAAEQGCEEFASDCELENTVSQQFHQKLGFQEANRIVCFTKKLT